MEAGVEGGGEWKEEKRSGSEQEGERKLRIKGR